MPRAPVIVWVVRCTALIALFAGRAIFIPGVDALAINLMKANGGSSSGIAQSVSLFGVAMLPLLVVSIALVMLGSPDPAADARRHRIGAVVYLLWCTVSAYFQAQWLAGAGRGFADGEFQPVLVHDMGQPFLAMAVLTWVGAGAVLWFLAQWVTKRGEILGAVLFAGAVAVVQDLELLERASRLAIDELSIVIAPLAHAAPWTIGLLALWWAKPTTWPVQAPFRFQLRSRWEALLLPLAVAKAAGGSDFVAVPLAISAAIVVWISLRKTSQSRGHPGFLLAALVYPAVGLVLLALPVAVRMREARTPGPFAGGGNFEVELTCSAANADVTAADTKVFERRLERARVKSSVRSDAPGRLHLTLEQITSPQELLTSLTPRYRLRFQLVARDQSLLAPNALDWQAAGLSVERDYDGEVITGPTQESLGTLLAGVEVPDGFELSIECRESTSGTRCSPKLLEATNVLEGSAIREASVARDFQDQPNVSLVFDAEGKAQLSRLSSELGRQLAIVLDGKILSAPTIQSRIDEGRASISMGRPAGGRGQQLRDAQRLADGLQSSPLECEWRTASVLAKP